MKTPHWLWFLFVSIQLALGTTSSITNSQPPPVNTNIVSFESRLIKGLPFYALPTPQRNALDRTNHALCTLYDLRISEITNRNFIRYLIRTRQSLPTIQLDENNNVVDNPRLNILGRMEQKEEREWGFAMHPDLHAGSTGGTYFIPVGVREELLNTNLSLLELFDARAEFIRATVNDREMHNRMADASWRPNVANPFATREARESDSASRQKDQASRRLKLARLAVIQEREADNEIASAQNRLNQIEAEIDRAIIALKRKRI